MHEIHISMDSPKNSCCAPVVISVRSVHTNCTMRYAAAANPESLEFASGTRKLELRARTDYVDADALLDQARDLVGSRGPNPGSAERVRKAVENTHALTSPPQVFTSTRRMMGFVHLRLGLGDVATGWRPRHSLSRKTEHSRPCGLRGRCLLAFARRSSPPVKSR